MERQGFRHSFQEISADLLTLIFDSLPYLLNSHSGAEPHTLRLLLTCALDCSTTQAYAPTLDSLRRCFPAEMWLLRCVHLVVALLNLCEHVILKCTNLFFFRYSILFFLQVKRYLRIAPRRGVQSTKCIICISAITKPRLPHHTCRHHLRAMPSTFDSIRLRQQCSSST